MKKAFLVFALGLFMVFAHSCKDETTPTPTPTPTPKEKTKTELLTTGSWTLSAATVDPAIDFYGLKISDAYAIMDACDKDDFMQFNADKTGFDDEGATKCDPSDDQRTPFTWFFNATETILTYDSADYSVDELTATSLKLSTTIDGSMFGEDPPQQHKLTATFKHQ